MQKIGARRTINVYDPLLAMRTTVTRVPRVKAEPLHREEALNRRQMIQFYTINNAILLRREREIGSLEAGKLADFIVIDTDLFNCPADAIGKTKVLATYLGGRRVGLTRASSRIAEKSKRQISYPQPADHGARHLEAPLRPECTL